MYQVKYIILYSDYLNQHYFKYDEHENLSKAIDIMKDAKEQFPDRKFAITTNRYYKWIKENV